MKGHTMRRYEHQLAVQKRLQELEQDGRLTPEAVIDDARDAKSPLHDEFEWDLEKAAYTAWLERARTLIRAVKYETHTEVREYSVPRYVRDPDAGADEQGYVSVPRILSDREVARRVLRAEVARAETLVLRAHGYAAVLNLEAEFKVLLAGIRELRGRIDIDEPEK